MDDHQVPRNGAAVRWFALAAVALSVASVAGARSLSWLSRPGGIDFVTVASRHGPSRPVSGAADIDDMPTGSIPVGALVIRLR